MTIEDYLIKHKVDADWTKSDGRNITVKNSKHSQFNFLVEEVIGAVKTIAENPDYNNELYETNGISDFKYDERPYRKVLKAAAKSALSPFVTQIGSQTLPSVFAIEIVAGYMLGFKLVDIHKKGHFTTGDSPLFLIPEVLIMLSDRGDRKNNFEKWMELKGLSSRSQGHYSGAVGGFLSEAAKINLYEITQTEFPLALARIENSEEYKKKNKTGNDMYQAAFNNYREFLYRTGVIIDAITADRGGCFASVKPQFSSALKSAGLLFKENHPAEDSDLSNVKEEGDPAVTNPDAEDEVVEVETAKSGPDGEEAAVSEQGESGAGEKQDEVEAETEADSNEL